MLASDFLFTFEDEFHVVFQEAVPDEILEGLDMHECLSLVVIGASSPDCAVVDFRLERVGIPFLERFSRLYVVVAIDEDGLV